MILNGKKIKMTKEMAQAIIRAIRKARIITNHQQPERRSRDMYT